MSDARPPLPPFDEASARQKVLAAEAAWNTRDPQRVALAYTEDSEWRNRDEFLRGRDEIVAFLTRKWERELDYVLRKEPVDVRRRSHRRAVPVRVARRRRARGSGRYGNELWEFAADGRMRRREASINDVAIAETDRRIFGPRADGDTTSPPLR